MPCAVVLDNIRGQKALCLCAKLCHRWDGLVVTPEDGYTAVTEMDDVSHNMNSL